MDRMSLVLLVLAFIPLFFGKFRYHGTIKLCFSSLFLAFCGVRNTDMSLSHESELVTSIFYFVLFFIGGFLGMGLMYLGVIAEADIKYELSASNGVKDKDNPYYMD